MMSKMGRRREFRKHIGSLGIFGIVVVLGLFVLVGSAKLRNEIANKQEVIAQLDEEISAEKAKKEEIEEYAKYVKTKKFVEEVAKEKFGLVYENEIIFKAED